MNIEKKVKRRKILDKSKRPKKKKDQILDKLVEHGLNKPKI